MRILSFITALLLTSCKEAPEKEQTLAQEAQSTASGGTEIIIETSMGSIKAQLHEDTAPLSVKNFLSYVDEGFYDGTIFHRVISNFMIQGGGFEISGSTPKQKKSKGPIRNESQVSRKNTRGTLAMARLNDPHSASNQFYINVQDNPSLDFPNHGGGYAVFGEVTEGMEIVDKIKEVKTHSAPMLSLVGTLYKVNDSNDVPIAPVLIQSIRRVVKTDQ